MGVISRVNRKIRELVEKHDDSEYYRKQSEKAAGLTERSRQNMSYKKMLESQGNGATSSAPGSIRVSEPTRERRILEDKTEAELSQGVRRRRRI